MIRYMIAMALCGMTLCGAVAAPLSLADAVRNALAHNPEVAAAAQNIKIADAKYGQVAAKGRPAVNLDAAYFDLSKQPTMSLPTITIPGLPAITLPGLPLSSSTISRGALDVTVPLSTGGRVKNGLAQVAEGVAALQAQAEATRREVAYRVVCAYLGAIFAQRIAEVADQASTTLQGHLTQAQALLAHGQIARYEVIRAESEVANQQRRQLDAHNQVELALAYLQDVMGLPKEDTPTLSTDLQGSGPFSRELQAAIDSALGASSTMKALQARDRLYAAGERSARAEKNPVVAATASKQLYMDEQPFTTPGLIVGVVMTVPLSDGGLAKAQEAEQAALRERNQSDMRRLENGIRLEVRKYYLDLQSARKALEAADTTVALATESLRLATRRFEEGQGTGLEKSDAILARSLAETSRAQAKYQYDIAYYGMQHALGTLVPNLTAVEGAHDGRH
ncbi:MAG TPA: TolC family protein [Armatimonadota bacterium]|jgi:outer membrane protein TolC